MKTQQAKNVTPLAPYLMQKQLSPDAPHDDMLEDAVMACIFAYPNFPHKLVAEVGDRPVFFYLRHQYIYDAVRAVINEGGQPDVVTVSHQLVKTGQLESIGGPAYFTQLIANYHKQVFRAPDMQKYIDELKGYYARREMILAADEMKKRAYDLQVAPPKTLQKTQAIIDDVGRFVYRDVFTPISVDIHNHADRTEQSEGDKLTIPTGIPPLDNVIEGLQRGKISVLAGRLHHSKTSVGISICLNMARAGARVAIFNIGDGNKHDVLSRIIAMEGGLSFNSVRTGQLGTNENGRYIEAMSKLRKFDLHVQSTIGMTMPQLQSEARALAGMRGLDMIFVDYIQELSIDTSHPHAPKTLYEQLKHFSGALTKIADDLNVAMLVAAQINRKGEGSMPSLSNIEGCDKIGQRADMGLLVYRPWLDDNSFEYEGQIQIKVAKNKVNGKLGTAICNIHPLSTYVKAR
jgi:replicative DNA helicase